MAFFAAGYWAIGPNPEDNKGGIATQKKSLSSPPETEWKYWNSSSQKWVSDSEISVEGKIISF